MRHVMLSRPEKEDKIEQVPCTEKEEYVELLPFTETETVVSQFRFSSRMFVETTCFEWCLEGLSLCDDFRSSSEIYGPVCKLGSSRFCLSLIYTFNEDEDDGWIDVGVKKVETDGSLQDLKCKTSVVGEAGLIDKVFVSSDGRSLFKLKFLKITDDGDRLTLQCTMQLLGKKSEGIEQLSSHVLAQRHKKFCFWALVGLLGCLWMVFTCLLSYGFIAFVCPNYYEDMHQLVLQTSCKLLHVAKALNLSQDHLALFFSSPDRVKYDLLSLDPVNVTSLSDPFSDLCPELF